MPPQSPSQTSSQVLRPKSVNHPPVDLRPEPPNPAGEAYLLCLLHYLDTCHCPSSTARLPCPLVPLLDLVNHCLDLVNTIYSTCTLVIHVPKCQPPTVSVPAPLFPRSMLHVTRLYLSFSIAMGHLCAPYLRPTSQETCCINTTLNAMVSL
jgi:hypothetical protein